MKVKLANESNSISINANAVAYNKDELISKVEDIHSTIHMHTIFISGKSIEGYKKLAL